MAHDDRCEIARFPGWSACRCAERAYVASCDTDELAEFVRNTGWKESA